MILTFTHPLRVADTKAVRCRREVHDGLSSGYGCGNWCGAGRGPARRKVLGNPQTGRTAEELARCTLRLSFVRPSSRLVQDGSWRPIQESWPGAPKAVGGGLVGHLRGPDQLGLDGTDRMGEPRAGSVELRRDLGETTARGGLLVVIFEFCSIADIVVLLVRRSA